MYRDNEREADLLRKANFYDYNKEDSSHRYENKMKNYADYDKIKIVMTHKELERLVFKKVMDAQEHLLNILMPRLKEIDGKQKALFNVMDQCIEDHRDLMKENETIQRQLQIIEKADNE